MSKGVIIEVWEAKRGRRGKIKSDDFPKYPQFDVPKGREHEFIAGADVEFKASNDKYSEGGYYAFWVALADKNKTATRPKRSELPIKAAIGEHKGFYLPTDTSRLLHGDSSFKPQNAALSIHKYNLQNAIGDKKILPQVTYSTKEERDLLKNIIASQQLLLSSYNGNYCSVTGTLGSRMAIGLGGSSVFETSITLHHTYAFPYIGGQTIKGCFRSYIIRELFGSKEDAALDCCGFVDIFGDKLQIGEVVFLDAFPLACDKLQLDVMTPHFKTYYQEGAAPTDNIGPAPIGFYTIPAGTKFVFRFCSKKMDINKTKIKDKSVYFLFKEMLSDMGIGAKTAVGYGWFMEFCGDKSESK